MVKQIPVEHPEVGEALVPETALGHYLGIGWVPKDKNLAARSKAELEELADEKGVPKPPKATKAQLVEALTEH